MKVAVPAEPGAPFTVSEISRDWPVQSDAVSLDLECRPAGGACPEAGATIVVTVRSTVALPLVPPVLGLDRLASIPIEATAAQKMSRRWGAP